MEIMENMKYYTNERNVQIVISLLKAHGIRKVVASPGTTNITLVGSMMHDDWFEIFSSVDERSAAYLACGLASESGEPVVLSCTGATASRNYMPGLTEAYYRKLPVVAITSHQGNHKIGHLIAQNIDRTVTPNDITLRSVSLPVVKDKIDERYCEIEANKALLELKRNGGGPVHINLITTYSKDFSVKELPHVSVIRRYFYYDQLPTLSDSFLVRIAVFIGSHKEFSDEETAIIDAFCATHDAVVFCDHSSGYHGRYAVHAAMFFQQAGGGAEDIKYVDLLIHIGEVSGDYSGMPCATKQVWRVSEDGEIRDTFGKITKVFQMRETDFFSHYVIEGSNKTSFLDRCKQCYETILSQIPELPFSNVWIASTVNDKIPTGSQLHLGILNTLRSWNMFYLPAGVTSRSNVGGFGIDGNMSSLIGSSLACPDKLYFGIFGDLSFFYDMNVLGNKHLKNNVRIMLINNGKGTEFRNYDHPGDRFGERADDYIAAAGHFGNKSKSLVKHYAEDLGFKYLSASNKEEFLDNVEAFFSPSIGDSPVLFECFTDSKDESSALFAIRNIIEPSTSLKAKSIIASAIGEKGVKIVKKLRNRQ